MAWPTEAGSILKARSTRKRGVRKCRRSSVVQPLWALPHFVPYTQSVLPKHKPRARKHRPSRAIGPTTFRGRWHLDMRGTYRVFNDAAYRFYESTRPAVAPGEWEGSEGWNNATLDAYSGNLIALYKLDESSGSAVDVINAINGTASGSPSYGQSGVIGNCVEFDGTDDKFVTAQSASFPATDFTLALWVYCTNYSRIAITFDGASYDYDLIFTSNATEWRQGITAKAETSLPLGQDAWHHVVLIRTSGDHAVYYDGVSQSLDTNTNDTSSLANSSLIIGEHNTVFWEGKLDQVVIWDDALSSAAITALYNSGDGRPYVDLPLADMLYATNASLPHEPSDTFGDGVHRFAATYFNGVVESDLMPIGPNGETWLRLDVASGAEANPPPSGPADWRLEERTGGVIAVCGAYYQTGTLRATQWAITYTTDDSNPGTGSPDVTVTMPTGLVAELAYALPAQSNGTVVKVRLQTRRQDGATWYYSEDLTIKTVTVDTIGPAAPPAGEVE